MLIALGIVGLVVLLLIGGVFLRGVQVNRLYTETHVRELLQGVADLKARALAATPEDQPPTHLLTSAPMALAYSIAMEEGLHHHHLSISTPVTPAVAATTYVMGLVLDFLDPPPCSRDAFVSENKVLHVVLHMSAVEHQRFVEQAPRSVPGDLQPMRAAAVRHQQGLIEGLQRRSVPSPP